MTRMKIKPAHFEDMKIMIQRELCTMIEQAPDIHTIQDIVNMYETGQFIRADKVKDLQKRFCFDLWYACGGVDYYCNNLYDYLTDVHMYTALKRVCPQVTKRY